MKIGIKYCGGCNPTYDRTEVVSRLKKHLSEGDSVETIKQGIIYDIVVILCGCNRACANYDNLEVIYEKIFITSEYDSAKLFETIDKIKHLQSGE
ncbi:hypothetical protein LGK95_21825 [Clostridium algoriphilum]|uniref:hypothetical protein n=1 Tax=Clostridium algoriphilum TaxID=198347 RepID=UPI001CF5252D|nr:hypothetical protein [Clostridium algoriphilum]MCB2296092.1 hypothetical protein [Clostridium algoriphilum]